MDVARASKAAPVILLFGALAASAATGFPGSYSDGYMPRGARALDFVVRTFGTEHFGPVGGAVFFAVLGLFLTGLVMIGPRGEIGEASTRSLRMPARRADREEAMTSMRSPTDAPRRRTISAQAFSSTEHDATRQSPPAATALAGPRPAWGLMLASPWSAKSDYTSWLGGLPCAPSGFEWPRETEDREPMHFYAQIDLADLVHEPITSCPAPGLPETGAMLVFIGHGCAVKIISALQMENAQPVAPPSDLPSLRKFGFWVDSDAFPSWPIVPRVFLDRPYDEEDYDGEAPAAFPDPHRGPADWITNWGIAALEADTTITTLGHEIRNAQWAMDYQLKKLAGPGAATPDDERLRGEAFGALDSYKRLLLTEAPALVSELEAWKARAESSDPMEPVDPAALAQLFEKRLGFCAREPRSYAGTIALRGAPYKLWERICSSDSGDTGFFGFRELPEPYRRFAEERITGWRRHRLFGFEPPFSNNWEDLDGKAPLISIGADALLGTQTEHEYGLSLWGPTGDLEIGRYDRLEIVRHCAV